MVTTGNGRALPDLASSTNALSYDDQGRCVAGTMAQDPISEETVRLARAFRISHGFSQWPELSEEPPSAIGCATSPACANLARVAGLESVTPAAVYHLRGSDSDLSQAPLLLPSSTSLATSSVPSFISCVRQLCYMDVTIQNTRQEILRYLLAI